MDLNKFQQTCPKYDDNYLFFFQLVNTYSLQYYLCTNEITHWLIIYDLEIHQWPSLVHLGSDT